MSELHPLASSLALLILAQRLVYSPEDLSTTLALVLGRYLPKWEDERVADLNARLLEKLTALSEEQRLRFFVVARACSDSLCAHDDCWEATT